MRLNIGVAGIAMVVLSGLLFASFGQGDERYVAPRRNNVGLFANEVRKQYEEPIRTLGTNDRLLILETKRFMYKVQAPDGTVGFVEKERVASTGRSRTFVFDNADVFGYLDNPTPVYIIDADDPNASPISLDRSFKDALRENVDRETVERQVQ